MICKKYILAPECREEYIANSLSKSSPIGFGGRSYLRNYYHIYRPDPDDMRLIFSLKGTGTLKIKGHVYSLKAGDVFLLPKNISHEYWLENDYWEIAWLAFVSDFDSDKLTGPLIQKTEIGSIIGEIITQLSISKDLIISSQLMQLLESYFNLQLEAFYNIHESDENIKFKKLYSYVAKNLDYNWHLASLMQRGSLHYSKVHFNRLCIKFWGNPAIQTVIKLRLNEAARLLKYTDYPVKLIASRVGYSNQYAFSNAFKRHYGISPSRFR